MSAGVDVAVLWELLSEEGGRYDPSDLAELAIGETSPEALADVVDALAEDRIHFKERKGRFEPRSAVSVQESLRQRKLAEEREERLRATTHAVRVALSSGRPLPVEEHEEVLRPIVDLAVYGDAAPKKQAGEELLGALGWRTKGALWLSAFRLLNRLGWFEEDENLLLRRFRVPTRFPATVLEEAEQVVAGADPAEDPARVDRTGAWTLAIDDAETREVDDALSAEPLPDGGTRVEVHIADAAAFVPSGGAIEHEAARRAATVYLPDRMLPMLPPDIGYGVASLGEGIRRPALTFRIDLDARGQIQDFEPFESVISVDRRLTYRQANALLGEDSAEGRLLRLLRSQAKPSLERRLDAGAISLQPPEVKVRVGPEGKVVVSPIDRGSAARGLVAEWMILTGHLCARWVEAQGIAAIYRCQSPPDTPTEQFESDDPTGMEIDPVRFYALVRQLRKAIIGTRPGLHAGLGVHPYVQVTSPLRRFPDLMLHRQIKGWLRTGEAPLEDDALLALVGPAEETSSRLTKIERETNRYFTIKHLATRQGEELGCVVLAEKDRGRLVVELEDLALQATLAPRKRRSPGDWLNVRVTAAQPREDRLALKEVTEPSE